MLQNEDPTAEQEPAWHTWQFTVPPDEVQSPSLEDRDNVTVGPYDPAKQFQVYEDDLAAGTGFNTFVQVDNRG